MTPLPDPRSLAWAIDLRGSDNVAEQHGVTPAQLAEHMGEHGWRVHIHRGRVRYFPAR